MRVFRPLVLTLLLIAGGGIFSLSAQNRVVTGQVMDAKQQPLMGVAVLIEGTTKGTTTTETGDFSIEVAPGETTLSFLYLGYLPQKKNIAGNQDKVTVYLQEDAIMLDASGFRCRPERHNVIG